MSTDDLDEHAAAHCSHLSPSLADLRRKMANVLTEFGTPFSYVDRLVIYEKARIPDEVAKSLDLSAFHLSLSEKYAREQAGN